MQIIDNIESLIRKRGVKFLLGKISSKVTVYLKNMYRRELHWFKPTYTSKDVNVRELNFAVFNKLFLNEQQDKQDVLFNICNRILEHKFDILGQNDVKCGHLQYNTYRLHKLTAKPTNFHDHQDYIKKYINNKNQRQSILISRKLSEMYELIDWQRDYVSGFRWKENIWNKKIRYGDIKGVDIKVPWEIGRLQFLPWMAKAAEISGNPKYIDEADNILIDFIMSNPPYFGTQWMTAMDAAIRAVNISAYLALKNKISEIGLTKDIIISKSLEDHFDFILKNLEWSGGMRGNHYFAGLCGLIILSAFLNCTFQKIKILKDSLNKFADEILYQFGKDGGNFEASLPYHHFVAEMLFTTLESIDNIGEQRIELLKSFIHPKDNFFIDNHKIVFKEEVHQRIQEIKKFSDATTLSSGNFPKIGDDDSGYFIRTMPPYILSANGMHVNKDLSSLSKTKTLDNSSFKFDDFGLYIFNRPHYKLYFRCGNLGQRGKGGHAHNDQLSFCLFISGNEIFTDPGSYNYTAYPDLRNLFRSTAYHNVLQIDNYEQNHLPDSWGGNLFWLEERTNSRLISFDNSQVEAEHQGFGVSTMRKFMLEDNKITAIDRCGIQGEKFVYFHLHPSINPLLKADNHVDVALIPFLISLTTDNGKFTIEAYDYATEYGKKVKAFKIVLTTFDTTINWQINIDENN